MFGRKLFHLKQSALNRLTLLKSHIQLPEKWKGGRIEKWSQFWQYLMMDYRSVAADVVEGAKAKPRKAVFVTAGLGVVFTALNTNPDEQSFCDNLIQNITALAMVGDPIRNPSSEDHIQYLNRCQNQGLLRQTNLLFLTLLWVADYDKNCNIYAAQCKYLQPKYATFYERIIDVGIFGVWWNMKLKMKNYDINPQEWTETT